MQQTTVHALEEINNPILVILLCALLAAVGALWWDTLRMRRQMVEIVIENIGAIKDFSSVISKLSDRFDAMEESTDHK